MIQSNQIRCIILKSAPKKDEIQEKIKLAQAKQRTEVQRMQFPKVDNY